MSSTSTWLVATLEPVSLFSLRSAFATSKGGKTLLVPTPYAIKMALLDACFRLAPGADASAIARHVFDLIKACSVRIQPPATCIVQHTFVRALQPARGGDDDDTEASEFSRTIMYREFVHYSGTMRIALACDGYGTDDRQLIRRLFFHLNQLGKRGSFWQTHAVIEHGGPLPDGFSLRADEIATVSLDVSSNYRTTQYLDDFGPALCRDKNGFERVSTYHEGRIELGKHRVLEMYLLPLQRRRTGRHFTEYRGTLQE